ncbi:hypothetical protein UFOVP447_249 [uncultured Caudovirales phage]|uniref:Curlin associated n=1 Tax=uncultured Caudovirales phage TaxID=2100421 RepID=A0A6J5MAT5_9CAUD|nr:hypothetical protein UFOVP447_249 [uncultured Caudovirales phage]
MKLIKRSILVMALMTPTLSFGQSTTNSIYIQQVGDSSTITIKQEGQGNEIGNRTTDTPVVLQGDGQVVDITMQGNTNKINGDIKQSDGSTTTVEMVGDSNELNFDVGNAADTGGSTTTFDIAGSSNEFNFNQGKVSSATNLTQTFTLTGDLNTVTQNVETNDVENLFTVAGDSNVITTTQNGASGKNIEMVLTGDQNNVTVNQKSTLNVDSIKLNSTSSGSTILINQCNAGGC